MINKEVINSWIMKLLPIVLAFVVGKGWISQEIADQVTPAIVNVIEAISWLLLAGSTVVGLIRSIRAYKNNPKPTPETTPAS